MLFVIRPLGGPDIGGVFGRGKPGKIFKMSGKVMDGIVSQMLGNLREIHMVFTD